MTSTTGGTPFPEDEPVRKVSMNIALTVEQHKSLKTVAALEGETLAEIVGRLAIEEADRKGVIVPVS